MTDFYYIKTPIATIIDADLPDSVFRNVCKLLTTAREFNYWRTPEMTIMELANICNVSERTMWGHLSVMRESAHVRVVSPHRGHYVIYFDAFVPDSAEVCSSPVVVHGRHDMVIPDNHEQQPSGFLEGGVGGGADSANSCSDVALRAELCTELGEPVAMILLDKHPAERISEQIAHYRWAKSQGKAEGPGWLVRAIEEDYQIPDTVIRTLKAKDPTRYISGPFAEYINH